MQDMIRRLQRGDGRINQQAYILGFALPFILLCALSWFAFSGKLIFMGQAPMIATAFGWTLLIAFGDGMNIARYHDIGHSGSWYRLLRPGVVLLPAIAFGLQFLLPAQLASMGDMGALMYMMGQDLGGWSLRPIPTSLLLLTLTGVAGNVLFLSLMPTKEGDSGYTPSATGPSSAIFDKPKADPDAAKQATSKASAEEAMDRALQAWKSNTEAAPVIAGSAAPVAGPARFGGAQAKPGFGKRAR